MSAEKDTAAFNALSEADFKSRYWRQLWGHRLRHFMGGESSSQPLETAIAFELLAQVSMQEHKREQAGYCAMRALRLGRSLTEITPVVGRAYASLCLVESAKEKTSKTTIAKYKRKALDTCTELNELQQLSYTLLTFGGLAAGEASWDDASDNLKQSASIAERLKDKRQWEESLCHQAHLEYYRGGFSESKALYEEASASAKSRGDKQIANRCSAGIAAVLLAMDQVDGAMAILEKTNSFGQLALALLRSGRRDEALQKALLVKDKFEAVRSTKYYVLKGFVATAEVILKLLEDALTRQAALQAEADARAARTTMGLRGVSARRRASAKEATRRRSSDQMNEGSSTGGVRLDDVEALTKLAEQWIEKLEQFGNIYPVARPRALLLKGQFQLLQYIEQQAGDGKLTAKALSTFRKSLQCAKSLSMPYDEALALYELGKHSEELQLEKERSKHLSQAMELFEKRGAAYDVNRCKLQLDRGEVRL